MHYTNLWNIPLKLAFNDHILWHECAKFTLFFTYLNIYIVANLLVILIVKLGQYYTWKLYFFDYYSRRELKIDIICQMFNHV